MLISVEGPFYRAVDPDHRAFALSGSRAAGRYSRPDQPTLYLSASPEGVAAAMIAHQGARSAKLETLELTVRADGIFDLRDPAARDWAGISLEDATAAWQDLAADARTPPSWTVRDRLEGIGAKGLIDPSRKSPGLWHLVLFAWNRDGTPTVTIRN